ncbi:MAG: hypothetical protein EXQ70_11005 [Solirubrobacterales bacterium]|nr:hypothetical protein [Solirubrobacterales bacterium]
MKPEHWIERFAEGAGVQSPSAEDVEAILDLAGTAAHASERTAAPVACWIGARSGRPLDELAEIAARVGGGD